MDTSKMPLGGTPALLPALLEVAKRQTPSADRSNLLVTLPQLSPEQKSTLAEYQSKVGQDIAKISEANFLSTLPALGEQLEMDLGRAENLERFRLKPESQEASEAEAVDENSTKTVTRQEAEEHLKRALKDGQAIPVTIRVSCEYTGSGTREMNLESLDGEMVTLVDAADGVEGSLEDSDRQTETTSQSGDRLTMSVKDFFARLDSYFLPAQEDG